MVKRRYPGDDPRRTLPDHAVVMLHGKPDGELGHILVEWIVDRPLTWRDHVMLAQRFAAHLNAYADDVEEKGLRRHAGPQRRGRGRNLVRR